MNSRKGISLLLSGALLLSSPISVLANPSPDAAVVMEVIESDTTLTGTKQGLETKYNVDRGDLVAVKVKVTDMDQVKPSYIGFTLDFDESKLDLVDATGAPIAVGDIDEGLFGSPDIVTIVDGIGPIFTRYGTTKSSFAVADKKFGTSLAAGDTNKRVFITLYSANPDELMVFQNINILTLYFKIKDNAAFGPTSIKFIGGPNEIVKTDQKFTLTDRNNRLDGVDQETIDKAELPITVLNIVDPNAPTAPPAITGVDDGGVYKSVTPTFTGATAATYKIGDGAPQALTSGMELNAEGIYVLEVTNEIGTTTITFTIDTTDPIVTGVSEGSKYQTVTPIIENGATATLAKNGGDEEPYGGAEITDAGTYVLTVRDAAGNETIINFEIDKTGPTVTGVTDGGNYNTDKTVTLQAGETATLKRNTEEAASYNSGDSIAEEGSYVLVVRDAAGNETTVNFIIDKTDPVVTGVTNGLIYNNDRNPTFNEGDATLKKDSGEPATYESGDPISAEGTYVLTVTDAAGNVTTVTFTINKSAPVVTGVTDGTSYKANVTATFENATATLAKNGGAAEEYTSGTPITDEGSYVLVVTNTAGTPTTVNFTIDKTNPQVDGVTDEAVYNNDRNPTFTEGTATISKDDGAPTPFESGDTISEEGSYVLTVTDAAGNITTVTFTINKSAPVVNGVTDGTSYKTNVTPTFEDATATLAKDGGEAANYESGTEVTEEGSYVLVVTNTAGTPTTVNFTIDKTDPVVTFNKEKEGDEFRSAVTVTFNEGTATLAKDGGAAANFTSGTTITADGVYVLVVTDAAGNTTTENFTIDTKSAAVNATDIAVTNNPAGHDDVIVVTGLAVGDVVKVYTAATGGDPIATSEAVAEGETSVTINTAQVGATAGSIYVTKTSTGFTESVRVTKAFNNEPKQFAITSNANLNTTGSIIANVKVTPVDGVLTHGGDEVVIFQLMKGTTPVRVVSIKANITTAQDIQAIFDASGTGYTVKVFVRDSFANSLDGTGVGASLADAITITSSN